MTRIRRYFVRIATSPLGQVVLLTVALAVVAQLPGGERLLEAAQTASNILAPYQPPHEPVALLP